MSVSRATVDDATRDALLGLAVGDTGILQEAVDIREAEQQSSGLDPATFGLVKVAELTALDSPPASYLWQIANALDAGATPADMLGLLRAVAPQAGGPAAGSVSDQLSQLTTLHGQGILTDEEFSAAKAKVLGI